MQKLSKLATAVAVAAPLATFAPATTAHAEAARAACPAPFPIGDVREGMTGSGLTVSKGTTPEPFTVKVQGVLKDGIAPGVDMILAEADSPALDRAGAIWAGMSGSPVYASDGRLLGAVGYGFSGVSKLAGITPAKAMLDIWNRPDQSRAKARGSIKLPKALQQKVASRGLVSTKAAAAGLSALPLPYSVSGLSQRRVNALNAKLAKKGSKIRLHRAGRATGQPAPAGEAVAGGNFGVLQSYGTVTQGAIGTATVVCDGRALAFGHAYFQGLGGQLPGGPVKMAAVSGEALSIVPDGFFGPFKLANFSGVVGTLTQDRHAGVAARLGAGPAATPITAQSTANGSTRTDTTYVIRPEDVAGTAGSHTLASLDQARDEVTGGRVATSWKVRGTAAGKPFELTLGNRFAGVQDATFPASDYIAGKLNALKNNPYAPVEFTDLRMTGSADSKYGKYTLKSLRVKSGKRWVVLNPEKTLKVTRGRKLVVRAELASFQAPNKTVELRFNIPKQRRGTKGALTIAGGFDKSRDIACDPFEDPQICADGLRDKVRSFADLLARLKAIPRNDSLLSSLSLGKKRVSATKRLDQITSGQIVIRISIR